MPYSDREVRPTLLVVDDEPTNLQVLRQILQADYRLLFARDGHKALELARSERPDLILLDVMMPGMTGHEACAALKGDTATRAIPVIFVTALAETDNEALGFELGAVDYIVKPVSPPIVKARVRNHLSLVRMDELIESRMQIIERLGRAAEYKDNETGLHVIRMSHYAQTLALAAGWSPTAAQELLTAAPMHDIGKIGIPITSCARTGRCRPKSGRSCAPTRASGPTSSASILRPCCVWPERSRCTTTRSGTAAAIRTNFRGTTSRWPRAS